MIEKLRTAKRQERAAEALEVADSAMLRFGIPAAGIALIVFIAVAVWAREPDLFFLAGMAGMVMGILIVSRARQWSVTAGVVIATLLGLTLIAPGDRGGLAIAIPLVMLAMIFVSVFLVPRRAAQGIALGGLSAGAWALYQLHPDLGPEGWAVVASLAGGTLLAAYLVFWWVEDARSGVEVSYRILFEDSPAATFERDYSEVVRKMARLRAEGCEDIWEYLSERPEVATEWSGALRVRRANRAAMELFGFQTTDEVNEAIAVMSGGNYAEVKRAVYEALWDGAAGLEVSLEGVEIGGRHVWGVLSWRLPEGVRDYSKVILTIVDYTNMRRAEAAAARAERVLAAAEVALAQCAEALLLGWRGDAEKAGIEALSVGLGGVRGRVLRRRGSEDAGDASGGEVVAEVGEERAERRSVVAVEIVAGAKLAGRLEVWVDEAGVDGARRLLEVAAPMFGAYVEREEHMARMRDVVVEKDRFIASVGHELRTPLASVIGFGDLLANAEMEPSEVRELASLVVSQGMDLSAVVDDLLVAARAELGTVSVRRVGLEVAAEVEAVLEALIGIGEVRVDIPGGLWVWADPLRLRQILRNLLTNANRYGGPDVVLAVAEEEEWVRIEVSDDGDGIPEAVREKIFDSYVRGPDSRVPESLGLGLSVVRQLAELMSGTVSYRYEGGRSVFTVKLPKMAREAEAVA